MIKDHALYFFIMNTRCTVCKEAVLPEHGLALVRGYPYNSVTHYKCRMHMTQDCDWPHDMPVEDYKQLAISNSVAQNGANELDSIQSPDFSSR